MARIPASREPKTKTRVTNTASGARILSRMFADFVVARGLQDDFEAFIQERYGATMTPGPSWRAEP